MISKVFIFLIILGLALWIYREIVRRLIYKALYTMCANDLIYENDSDRWNLGIITCCRVSSNIRKDSKSNEFVTIYKYKINHSNKTAIVCDYSRIYLATITPIHTMDNAVKEAINKMKK